MIGYLPCRFNISTAMQNRDAGDFGLTVNLFKVHTQGMEKTEVVRSHGRSTGIGVPDPGQSQMVPQFLKDHGMGQPIQ